MKRALVIVFSALVLASCTSNQGRGASTKPVGTLPSVTTEKEQSSSKSDTSTTDKSKMSETEEYSSKNKNETEASDYSFVPYDEVHEFKNTPRPEAKLDDDGIYRYDFLDKDDAVYDMMSYKEVNDIYPVQKQDKIEVTLGTNFTLDGYNFNFKNLTAADLHRNVIGKGIDSQFIGTLKNGSSDTGYFRLPSQIGESVGPATVDYRSMNPSKREVSIIDAPITSLGVSHERYISSTKENLGARIAYEGINFFITRTEFINNVKINNPVYHDEKFYYGKKYDKKFKDVEISYTLDPGEDGDIHTGSDNSYVTFKFSDEILTSIVAKCQPSYLGIDVE